MSNAFSPMVTNPYTEHPQALDRATKVKLLVLDVDGVLTDGSLLIGQDGKEAFQDF
jgi:3-deoxy-D-manno-octulosonate 8-phosphate phosphatase (KDO 8-P phosphatase)